MAMETPDTKSPSPEREDSIRLFTFLKELAELRYKTIRTVDEYDTVLWLNSVPRSSGCYTAAWGAAPGEEAEELWVELKRPRLVAPPLPPREVQSWLDAARLSDSSVEMPELLERIVTPAEEPERSSSQVLELRDHPEIRPVWERYVERDWWPWAELDRKGQEALRVYRQLFGMYQRQQRLGEQYEVVLGIGLLDWRTPDQQRVRRHLLVVGASITFEAASGTITVGPGHGGSRPVLEQDMVDPRHRPNSRELEALDSQLEGLADNVWDRALVDSVLSGWVHSASTEGQYSEMLEPPSTSAQQPKIHFAPALILRHRTERAFIRIFEEILSQLRAGLEVPLGVKRFISILDDSRPTHDGQSDVESSGGLGSVAEEVVLPLEANEDQYRIVERLATRQGVLVQGPPGTGKSHTIVNLICHLLASGKRVLVTSHTARALGVLRAFIRDRVPDISPLAVMLLGEDRSALQAMEDSVQGITARHANWDSSRSERELQALLLKADQAKRQDAEIAAELRALREAEVHSHPPKFGGYEGTAQKIAAKLGAEAATLGWMPGFVEPELEPPLKNLEAQQLVALLNDGELDRVTDAVWRTLDPSRFPTPAAFAGLVSAVEAASARFDACASASAHVAYPTVLNQPQEMRDAIADRITLILRDLENVSAHIEPWTERAALEILADQDRQWRSLLTKTQETLARVRERAGNADAASVSGAEGLDEMALRHDAQALLVHLERGGGLGFAFIRPQVVKQARYLMNSVRVNGARCDNQDSLRRLVNLCDVRQELAGLTGLWNLVTAIRVSSVAGSMAQLEDLCEPLESALGLLELKRDLQSLLATVPGLSEPVWHQPASLKLLADVLEAVEAKLELEEAGSALSELRELAQGDLSSSAVAAIGVAIFEAVEQRSATAYSRAHELLLGGKEQRVKLDRRDELLARLSGANRDLFLQLTASPLDPEWQLRANAFEAAWNWARARAWLATLTSESQESRLRDQLDASRKRQLELTGKIAAAKAWIHCFAKMSEYERQHLIAWSKAMQRIGKGTGKHAPMHRQAAQEHMQACRTAIPAWIMPIYRVAESIRPGQDPFDVVIIDEASQSGPEALFLLFLAKQIVVVGDDKQIKPENVGLTREDVNHLRTRHIHDLPFSDAYGPETSFFELAEIRFGGRIRLREHFRCMPEIIQFSNDLCYRSEPLKPLRQFGSGRLVPVVAAKFVSGGFLKGNESRTTNPPEAEAIVNHIAECCADPAYEKKTFGVISLLAEEQARLIERLLVERIGPEEMERRRIVCGDAYAFQGDERDVMFLSLVSVPTEGRRIGVLNTPASERRFNVAASRARDQMWLYHSAALSDLSQSDLRYRLLEYCLNPSVAPNALRREELGQLRALARDSDRSRTRPPEPYDSWFEVDVCLAIEQAGYRVVPQYRIAGYRIDLLVEGMAGRLAVECDGDQWHGADRYLDDCTRQRQLERCGLQFLRIRGSAYYADPDGAMDSLFRKLSQLGIHPEGKGPFAARGEVDESSIGSVGGPTSVTETETRQPDAPGELPRGDAQSPHAETSMHRVGQIEAASSSGPNPQTVGEPPGQVRLAPPVAAGDRYVPWTESRLPDPRSADLKAVVEGLVEIVKAEGPMISGRAYRLFVRAAGSQRVGPEFRRVLNKALWRAIRDGLIKDSNEYGVTDLSRRTIWLAGTPEVVLRRRGSRDFDDIPLSELGAAVARIRTGSPAMSADDLHRAVLEYFETKRMTTNVRAQLAAAEAYATGVPSSRASQPPSA